MMLNLRNKSVNVNRLQLLETLRTNREKHIKEFNSAEAGYQEAMIEKLQETLKLVKKGKVKELNVALSRPRSYEKDYTETIEMLELSVDENINLDSESFRAYFKDEWSWSTGFKTLVASYSGALDNE